MNIVFDLDDTLYDVSKIFETSLNSIFPEVKGFDYCKMYATFRKYSNYYFNYSLQGEKQLIEMQINRIIDTLAFYNISCTREQAIRFHEYYEFKQYSVKLSNKVKEVLDKLQKEGYKLGLITNGDSFRQRQKIKSLGLTKYFEKNIIISGDHNYNKPDIEIFKIYEKMTNGSKFLFVGDSYEHDVVGALNSGWRPIWINRRGIKKKHSIIECKSIECLLYLDFENIFDNI